MAVKEDYRKDERSLTITPSWAVAVVVFVILVISIALEYALHLIGHWLHKRHKKSLQEALEKIKAELMILGFISLLLTIGKETIADICIPSKVARTWHPCNEDKRDDEFYDPCLKKGKVQMVSNYGIHQLHIFIFVLAVVHVAYCILTLVLGRLKMRRWKVWENETKTVEYQYHHGRDIGFWIDRWVGNFRLCDKFPRLYHLDKKKESRVAEKGKWVNNVWCWEWEWVRSLRGRVCKEFEELVGLLQNVVISYNGRDRWRWRLQEGGSFTVKDLSRLVEEKTLQGENGHHETLWNKLMPKKVNIFVWRALKRRLPVRVELDNRGIDLDSLLCPSCNNAVESCAHCLVTCDLAMSVWDKIFSWWKMGRVNAFSIDDFFSSIGNINVPNSISRIWQAVIWSSGYFIWKERNARVFGKKMASTNKIVQDIQLKSYEWIVRRSKKYKAIEWQKWLFDPVAAVSLVL